MFIIAKNEAISLYFRSMVFLFYVRCLAWCVVPRNDIIKTSNLTFYTIPLAPIAMEAFKVVLFFLFIKATEGSSLSTLKNKRQKKNLQWKGIYSQIRTFVL
jgi:p-aminobenzoyl-glutamate transporter AbgT